MARQTVSALYVIGRVALNASQRSQEPTCSGNDPKDTLSVVPCLGLTNRKKAEAVRADLERQARQTMAISPFLLGILPDRLNDIDDAIRMVGLPPLDLSEVGKRVEPDRSQYGVLSNGKDYFAYSDRTITAVRTWCEVHADEVSPEANAALWDCLFPDHRFYAVSRVLLGD